MKTIIVSGGTAPNLNLLKQEITNCSYLIGADSGADCLCKFDFFPHLVIGDLDSIKPSTLKRLKAKHIPIESYAKNKDCTDTQLALYKAILQGATEIVFLGCTGGIRIDHFFGNVGLLLICLEYKIKACIKDKNNIITIIDQPTTITGNKGETFSLHAYSSSVSNLSISGAKYTLSKHNLKLGSTLTLSNEFLDQPVCITFKKGKLLLIKLNTELSH